VITTETGPARKSACRALVTALLVLMMAACTVPSDDEARPIDPARLVSASNKANCTAPGVGAESVTVNAYLVNQQREPPFVTPVDRVITDKPPTPYEALNALVNCRVTDDDRRNGLATSIPEGTELLGLDPVSVPGKDGVCEVRLGRLPNRGSQKADDLDKLAVAQIFFTVTGPGLTEQVSGLKFMIDGRPVAVNTDRRTVSQNDVVTRDDFLSSSPPPTTTSVRPATTVNTSPNTTTTRKS